MYIFNHIVRFKWCFSPLSCQTLLSFLLPTQGRLRGQIEEALDLSLIQQQAENGALDIGRVAQFIIGMMGAFCAPCRDEDVKKLHDITDTVPLLKYDSNCCFVACS